MSPLPVVDFKGEALTFRATTAGVLETLAHCIELVNQREESWHKKLDREAERRRKSEALAKSALEQLQIIRTAHPGPDLEVSILTVIFNEDLLIAKLLTCKKKNILFGK